MQEASAIPPLWTRAFLSCWMTNLLLCLAYFPLLPTLPLFLNHDLGFSGSTVGLITSAYAFAALISRPIAGYLLDTYSRRNLYLGAIILFVASFAIHALAFTVVTLLLLRTLQGLLWGASTAAGNTLAADNIPLERRGEGLGYYGMAMPLAMGVGPVLGLAAMQTWGFSAVWIGTLSLGAIGIFFSFRIPPSPKTFLDKHEALKDKLLFVKGLPLAFLMIFVCFPQGVCISYAGIYGKSLGLENPGFFYIAIAIGGVISRGLIGKRLDQGHSKVMGIVGCLCLITAYLGLGSASGPNSMLAMGCLIGMGFGIMVSIMLTLNMNLARPNQRGAANATLFTAMDLGFGTGILCGGIIYEYTSLAQAFTLAGYMEIFVLALFLLLVIPHYNRTKRRQLHLPTV